MIRRAIAAGLFIGLVGCQASAPPPPVETVGALAAGPSTWSAPVHATTDFGHAQIVDTGDDDRTATVTTTTPADSGTDAGDLPEVAPKSDGVTAGPVR